MGGLSSHKGNEKLNSRTSFGGRKNMYGRHTSESFPQKQLSNEAESSVLEEQDDRRRSKDVEE